MGVRGVLIEEGSYIVERVIEKPPNPTSNLAITAIYPFTPMIFNALESTSEGVEGEIQLMDGVQNLKEEGYGNKVEY